MTKLRLWSQRSITCVDGVTLERQEEDSWSVTQSEY